MEILKSQWRKQKQRNDEEDEDEEGNKTEKEEGKEINKVLSPYPLVSYQARSFFAIFSDLHKILFFANLARLIP